MRIVVVEDNELYRERTVTMSGTGRVGYRDRGKCSPTEPEGLALTEKLIRE